MAVKQGNYLLVRVVGGFPLALHRVLNGIYMTYARLPDATFSATEYCHTPLSGVPGLWGTFAPRVNSAYDVHNKRSGTKFTRHNHLHREAV
eukprot:2310849-Pleurochrysis_carterae.AAC.1